METSFGHVSLIRPARGVDKQRSKEPGVEPDRTHGSFRPVIDRWTVVPWFVLGLAAVTWLNLFRPVFHLAAVIADSLAHGAPVTARHLHSDFFAFWPAGHIAATAEAARIYDPAWFAAWSTAQFGPGLPSYMQYFYPPPSLLTTLPLLPFGPAAGLLAWTLLISLPCIPLLRRAGAPWPVIAAGLLSAASLTGISIGEFGPIAGSAFIAALMAVSRRPDVAGGLFGLISLKPQAGLLGPVVLVARGEWRGLAVGIAVTAALAAAVTLVAGPAIWPAFLRQGMAVAHAHLIAPFPSVYETSGVSVFWMARSLGAPVGLAGLCQGVSALAASVWCWHAWRRKEADPVARAALTVCLTLLVTPYAYANDMTGLSVMVAWLAWRRGGPGVADALLWLWPALGPVIARVLHVEIAPLVILLGALRAARAPGGIGTPAPACYPAPI